MYIGIDLGGTTCRVAVVNDLENISDFPKKEFKLMHEFDRDFRSIIETVKQFAKEKIDAIGICTPSRMNDEKTMIIGSARNLAEWRNKPFAKMLTDEFNCRVVLENDAIAAGLGEAYFGHGKNKDFVYIIWGTGMNAAPVKWKNNLTQAEKIDWYKNFESWENACGGNDIKRRFGKPAEELDEKEWDGVMKDFQKELLIFSQKFPSSLYVFGGGIAIKQKNRLLNSIKLQNAEIRVSALGEDTGLYGAFALLK